MHAIIADVKSMVSDNNELINPILPSVFSKGLLELNYPYFQVYLVLKLEVMQSTDHRTKPTEQKSTK